MNIFLNEYSGLCFELNFELNHFSARINEKMNFQNVSPRAKSGSPTHLLLEEQASKAGNQSRSIFFVLHFSFPQNMISCLECMTMPDSLISSKITVSTYKALSSILYQSQEMYSVLPQFSLYSIDVYESMLLSE